MALDDMHIVGIGNNTIWHTILYGGGGWQTSFGNVNSEESNDPGTLLDVDCATDGADLLQVVASNNAGQLWHTIRVAEGNDGSWQTFFGDINGQESNPTAPGTFADVRCSAGAGNLHVLGDASGGTSQEPLGPWHTIRFGGSSPSWQSSFGYVPPAARGFNTNKTACAADSNGNLHVVGNDNSNSPDPHCPLQYTVRASDGSWTVNPTWEPANFPRMVQALSCACDSNANLCAAMINDVGFPSYAMYNSKGQWSQNWNTVNGGVPNPLDPDAPQIFYDMSCAFTSTGDVYFVGVGDSATSKGLLFYTLLTVATGEWTAWDTVNSHMSNPSDPGPFTSVGISIVTTAS